MQQRCFVVRVDDRERGSDVGAILEREYGMKVKYGRLRIGDYLIGDEIVVERKATDDFARSVVDGRLFRQAKRMKERYCRALMILEGGDITNSGIAVHPRAAKGALVSLVSAWQVPVLYAADTADTALLLWLVAHQERFRSDELTCRPGRMPKRLRTRQRYLLQGLPWIGPKMATRLLTRFGSVAGVINATEKEMCAVAGIGVAKAKQIRAVVTSDYQPLGLSGRRCRL